MLAPAWESPGGHLYQFERAAADAPWRLLEIVPVSLGKNGLGWGRGLHGDPPFPGPEKREGDLKSPAGIFALGPGFGYAPPAESATSDFPYLQVTENTFGIEDAASQYYNTIVDRTAIARPDWKDADHMLRPDDLYRYGMMVQHNPHPGPQDPPLGSCIFLHVWRGPGQATAGCTAMAQEKMAGLLTWLREAAQPRLVQLTRADYDRLRPAWDLPPLPSPPPLSLTLLGLAAIVLAVGAWLYSRRRNQS